MIARDRTRGGLDRSPAHAPRRWRNLISSKAIDPDAAGPSFKRGKLFQTAIDVGAALDAAAFILLTAAAYGVAFFILFFVRSS